MLERIEDPIVVEASKKPHDVGARPRFERRAAFGAFPCPRNECRKGAIGELGHKRIRAYSGSSFGRVSRYMGDDSHDIGWDALVETVHHGFETRSKGLAPFHRAAVRGRGVQCVVPTRQNRVCGYVSDGCIVAVNPVRQCSHPENLKQYESVCPLR